MQTSRCIASRVDSRHFGYRTKVLFVSLLAVGLGMPWQASAMDVKPSARLDLDYAWVDADNEPLHDHSLIRRAAIGIEGKFNNNWEFEAGYDFADHGEVKDVYLTYEGWDVGDVSVGQMKIPFGLADLTSSKSILFIERALPVDAFGISRRLGVAFSRERQHYTFTAMAFGRSVDEDAGSGAGARFTYAPVNANNNVLHLGVSFVTEDPLQNEVEYEAGPESKPTDVHFVRTPHIEDVNQTNRLGLELAWQRGPFTAQAEWMRANVDRQSHAAADFGGWYVEASWMFGGVRHYEDGKFKSPTLYRPFGTFELSARYSHLDLDDGSIRGGREDNVSVGINWYLSEYGRVMLNYIQVDSDRKGESDDPEILLLRTQIYF